MKLDILAMRYNRLASCKKREGRRMSAKITLLFTLFFNLFFFNACNNKDLDLYVESDDYSNAVDFVGNNYNLSLFSAALKQAGLEELLKEEGPYTVFAPDNQAFNDLGIVRASDFAAMNQDSLRQALLYHILPRRLYTADVPANTIDNKYLNMMDKELFIGYQYRKDCAECVLVSDLYVNGSKSVSTSQNVVLANGVLHMVDKVLKYYPSLQDVIMTKPEFSLFMALLKRTGSWDRLAQPAFTTVFAPNNEAFEKAGITADDIANLDPSKYGKRLWQVYLLNNHFFLSDMTVYGQMSGSGYYGGPFYRTSIIGDEGYYFGISSNTPMEPFIIHSQAPEPNTPLRISSFLLGYQTDYKAENGVLHGIGALLVLPEEALIKDETNAKNNEK
ncbi:MAG: fasciclin domain-containing protein [Sphingobacterium sp.]|jgi:uncharacterized surface protein with fasciclin (FAS1) repeats|nr:fasciclin domain-containing protein [Sphingobacterium sp.]